MNSFAVLLCVLLTGRGVLSDHSGSAASSVASAAIAQASAALANAPASSYDSSAAAPVSTYYYYYPVAAYPIHNSQQAYDRNGNHGSSGGYSGGSGLTSGIDKSPIVFLLVPLVLLLLAVPALALLGANVNTGRGFDSLGRSSDLDEKFGSFADLQSEIDLLLGKYMVALESDQCMDRIVCEMGVKASGLPNKDLLFK